MILPGTLGRIRVDCHHDGLRLYQWLGDLRGWGDGVYLTWAEWEAVRNYVAMNRC